MFFINAWTQRLALLGQMNLFDTIQLNQSIPILPRLNTQQSIPKARIIPIIDLGLRYNPSISGKTSTGFLWDLQRSKWFMRVGGGAGINTVLPAGFVQNGTTLAAFGSNTCKAIEDAGLNLHIKVPSPQVSSMFAGLDQFLAQGAKKK
jgi:hypothetical protein